MSIGGIRNLAHSVNDVAVAYNNKQVLRAASRVCGNTRGFFPEGQADWSRVNHSVQSRDRRRTGVQYSIEFFQLLCWRSRGGR